MTKTKHTAAPSGVAVYVGPNIPNVVKKNTVFRGDIPQELREWLEQTPALLSLVVPAERMKEAAVQLRRKDSVLAALYAVALQRVKGGN